jgi:hypothetical protein
MLARTLRANRRNRIDRGVHLRDPSERGIDELDWPQLPAAKPLRRLQRAQLDQFVRHSRLRRGCGFSYPKSPTRPGRCALNKNCTLRYTPAQGEAIWDIPFLEQGVCHERSVFSIPSGYRTLRQLFRAAAAAGRSWL